MMEHIIDLLGHNGPVWKVHWAHPSFGKMIASCSYSKQALVWREESDGKWVPIIDDQIYKASVNDIQFSPCELGLAIASCSSDGEICIHKYYESTKKWSRHTFLAHNFSANCISWSPVINTDTKLCRLVSVGSDNLVKVWKSNNGEMTDWEEEPMESNGDGHTDWVRGVAWAPDFCGGDGSIASASADGTVKIWTKNNGRWSVKDTIDCGNGVWSVSWSPLGNVLAVTEVSGDVSLWEENCEGNFVPYTKE